jgi:hypothetical protein
MSKNFNQIQQASLNLKLGEVKVVIQLSQSVVMVGIHEHLCKFNQIKRYTSGLAVQVFLAQDSMKVVAEVVVVLISVLFKVFHYYQLIHEFLLQEEVVEQVVDPVL